MSTSGMHTDDTKLSRKEKVIAIIFGSWMTICIGGLTITALGRDPGAFMVGMLIGVIFTLGLFIIFEVRSWQSTL